MILHKDDKNVTLKTSLIYQNCKHAKLAEHVIECDIDSKVCVFHNLRFEARDCVCCDLYEE